MASNSALSRESELFEVIGSFGIWQKIVFGFFFYSNCISMWQLYSMTFLAPNVPFRCVKPANGTVLLGECYVNVKLDSNLSETVACTQWEYNFTDSVLTSEWDLVCDREWLISFSKSVYMLGFMVSIFVFGQLSDYMGRYPTILVCYVITFISLIVYVFSSSVLVFLVSRFMQAFGRTGMNITGYVLTVETVGPKYRNRVGIVIQVGLSVGLCTLAFVGYFLRDWFWLQVTIALPIVPLAFVLRFIPESPRWLLVHKKADALKKVILTASRVNKTQQDEDINPLLERLIKNDECEKKGTMLDLFRTPKLRSRTFIMMYLWIVNVFLYYGFTLNTNELSGDPYLNFFLTGILEFPSYATLYFASRRFGRRRTLVVLMIINGATCLALLQVPANLSWLSTGLGLLGKFFTTASLALLFIYTTELFPTTVRNVAFGSCMTVGRIGSIIAPFVKEIGEVSYSFVPHLLKGVFSVSSGLFALWLPETIGRKLPDTLGEAEEMI